ncbi:11729_t:CDS:2, partial [Rhizophagus irregularis]
RYYSYQQGYICAKYPCQMISFTELSLLRQKKTDKRRGGTGFPEEGINLCTPAIVSRP